MILSYLNVFERICKHYIAMASKRKRLSLNEKIEILEFCPCNIHMGVHAFADTFSVSKTQIAYIILIIIQIYKYLYYKF